MRFEDLRLSEPLLRAVHAAGYDTPTPIQISAIPHVLAGRDVLGSAQTGTGKTAAFALPILQLLSEEPKAAPAHPVEGAAARRKPNRGGKIRALVVCPTRELAQQIHDSFKTYGKFVHVKHAVAYGGVGQGPQVRSLMAGADILVATPGRLLDLMEQGHASLSGIEIFVVDEADRMMDMGFLPDLQRILAKLPRRRQTLFFSATMPHAIRRLADDILNDAVPVQVARVSSAAPLVEHQVYFVSKGQKAILLARLLKNVQNTRSLVFTRTKRGADLLTRQLVDAGIRAAALHGNKLQSERTRALEQFRSAHAPVLVATDIAARGLDIDDISHVYNYDLTTVPETYVHRIGRTGRAGASGEAVSFCTGEDHGHLKAIEQLLNHAMKRMPLPADMNSGSTHRKHESAAHGHSSHAHHAPQHAKEAAAVEPAPAAASGLFKTGGHSRRLRGRQFVRGARPGMRVP